jgi:hypothetical protein
MKPSRKNRYRKWKNGGLTEVSDLDARFKVTTVGIGWERFRKSSLFIGERFDDLLLIKKLQEENECSMRSYKTTHQGD